MSIEEIRRLAMALMNQHKLTNRGWKLSFKQDADNCGTCDYKAKEIKLSRILMYMKINHVKDIILHEIAHALCPHHGHDNTWRKKFISIGGSGTEKPVLQEIIRNKSLIRKIAKYTYICDFCHTEFPVDEISTHDQSCGICSPGKFDPVYMMRHEKNS